MAQGYSFMLSIFTVLLYSIALYNFPQQLCTCYVHNVICFTTDCSVASVKDEIYTVFTLIPRLELYQTLAVLEIWQTSHILRLCYMVLKMDVSSGAKVQIV